MSPRNLIAVQPGSWDHSAMAAAAVASPTTAAASPMALPPAVTAIAADMVAWRRKLHAAPELSFEERETAAFVAATLRSFGITEVTERVGRTGVVALIRGGGGAGECIALRADMDALPLQVREARQPRTNLHADARDADDEHVAGRHARLRRVAHHVQLPRIQVVVHCEGGERTRERVRVRAVRRGPAAATATSLRWQCRKRGHTHRQRRCRRLRLQQLPPLVRVPLLPWEVRAARVEGEGEVCVPQ